jgi:DNA-binding transcriptional LysR family regulator
MKKAPMSTLDTRSALSPDNFGLIESVARCGSMAAAARELGMVPSALTYRVRQIEDALDVLLFDRRSRRAVPTPAGAELLRFGAQWLGEIDAVAQRVKRVATGWESQLTIAADALIDSDTLMDLCEAFYALGAPTRLRLRGETLSGTIEALHSGAADLALGVAIEASGAGVQTAPLGTLNFVLALAPHHPLAAHAGPVSDAELRQHRAVAVADSTQRGRGVTHNLLPGQDVLTVPTMQHKLQAQLRGLGVGFLPQPLAQPHIDAGRLVVKPTAQGRRSVRVAYAWRHSGTQPVEGQALRWWLQQLEHPSTRRALLDRHALG